MHIAFSERRMMFVTEDALPQGEFNSRSILLGMGGVICLFILVIVLRHFKRLYSKRRKNVRNILESQEENHFRNHYNFQRPEENQRSPNTISESVKTGPVCESLETNYDEINEILNTRCMTFSEPLNVYDKAKNPF